MENKKNTAVDFANLIITYVKDLPNRKGSLTPIKLQKILYYVYVECLLKHQVKLFDTPIEKWKFGPVVASVYHNFKTYGTNHIADPTPSFVFDFNENGFHYEEIPFTQDSVEICSDVQNTIRQKVAELIDENPFDLVEQTHREEPWKKYESQILKGERGLVYSDEELIGFFSKIREL
ncbi:type II toxin-antitoxin system antitoxin SocA domain-containing protein [Acinetobacter sp. BMW17]|uniref:Panacea domain-containing protein n=1 Tax=Acinetobacter sp. BMW17 TaxID=1795629 RepID=UPI0007854982|nr:type II toxin-antitoxin system antitoxin SocA domain-containing protein [Acinetobacter sp. BMW17]